MATVKRMSATAPEFIPTQRPICPKERPLIMLDMNGTLIHRSTNRRSYCKRPYITNFIIFLFSHYKVGIWTSAREKNMRPIAKEVFGIYYDQLVVEWYRDKCDLRPTDEKHWNTVKDMSKLKSKFKAVIMIDDSKEKMVNLDDDYIHYDLSTYSGDNTDASLIAIIHKLSLLYNSMKLN